jgi:hypothetical protein
VVALREREAGVLPGTRRSRVPWEVVRRFSRWSLGSISVALAVLDLVDQARGRYDPDRFSLDWPLPWHLRDRIPHPFALEDQAAAEFSNACALRRGELPISDCFLEQLWRDTTASWRAMATREVDERSLAGRSMAPRGSTGQLDDYPRDEVASAVLTAAALAVWFDSDVVAELADRVTMMFARQPDEPLPPVFHLLGIGTRERWHQAAGPLTALLPTTYARTCAVGLGLPGVPERDAGWLDGSRAVGASSCSSRESYVKPAAHCTPWPSIHSIIRSGRATTGTRFWGRSIRCDERISSELRECFWSFRLGAGRRLRRQAWPSGRSQPLSADDGVARRTRRVKARTFHGIQESVSC